MDDGLSRFVRLFVMGMIGGDGGEIEITESLTSTGIGDNIGMDDGIGVDVETVGVAAVRAVWLVSLDARAN